jgi:hypothetical protein
MGTVGKCDGDGDRSCLRVLDRLERVAGSGKVWSALHLRRIWQCLRLVSIGIRINRLVNHASTHHRSATNQYTIG